MVRSLASSPSARLPLVGIRLIALVALAATCRTLPQQASQTALPAPPDSAVVTDRFVVPDGLEVTLWAESPLLFNPANIDVDARGRVWVAEAVNYRTYKPEYPERRSGDRVVILEDTDRDGVADSSKVFVQDEDLVAPMGIAVIGDQVIVSSSPSVIVYTDANGDDRPDRKEVFLTGFGGVDHDHGLHSFVAGPDGRWYFNAGNAGPHVVTDSAGWTLRSGSVYNGRAPQDTVNAPGGISDDGRIWTGGLALRIRPDGHGLQVLGHNFRNSYEVAVDSYGNLWQNDNDDEVVSTRMSWLMEGGNAGFFSADGSRTWRADQRPGQDLFTAHWHQEDPGVMPAGHRVGSGAPTGVVVYEGNALGHRYRGLVLSADAGRNSIFGYRSTSDGAGFRLEESTFLSSVAGTTADYLWSKDAEAEPERWFRPSDVAVGPDGAIYVADWFDPAVGGHATYDGGVVGRIYRIAPRDRALRVPVIDLETIAGQLEALRSPAINVRYDGFTRLRARGGAVVVEVKGLLRAENPYHRARAIWLLAQLGREGVAEVEELLGHADPQTRLTAYRALRAAGVELLAHARRLASDPSAAIRREVAISLRDVALPESAEIILELAEGYDGEDAWYLDAIGIASEGKEEALYPRLRARLGANDPARWDARFAGLAWRLHPTAALKDLKARAVAPTLAEEERERAIVALGFIDSPAAAQAMADLTRSELSDVARRAAWWLQYRQGNAWHDYAVTGAVEPEQPLTAVTAPELLRLRAILLDASQPVTERADAAAQLALDPVGGGLLIGILAADALPELITQTIRRTITENPARHVRVLVEQFFPRRPDMALREVEALQPNAERGQSLFYARCATCHTVGAVGGQVGPDLSQAGGKFSRAALLDAIIDPSENLAHGYEPNVVTTRDGRVLFGFILSRTPTLVLRDADGRQHTLGPGEVESIHPLTVSVMPRPSLLELNEQDVADLVAYLMTPR